MHANICVGLESINTKAFYVLGVSGYWDCKWKRLSINSKEFVVLHILYLPTYVKIRLSQQGIVACHILMSEFCKMIETTKYGSK